MVRYIYMYVQTSKLKLFYQYLYILHNIHYNHTIFCKHYKSKQRTNEQHGLHDLHVMKYFIQFITAVRLILHMQVDDGGEAQSEGIHCKQTSLLETISPGLGTCGTWDRKNRSCEGSEGVVAGVRGAREESDQGYVR